MPKVQQSGSKTSVVIPAEIARLMKWRQGDILTVEPNVKKDEIVLRRVKR